MIAKTTVSKILLNTVHQYNFKDSSLKRDNTLFRVYLTDTVAVKSDLLKSMNSLQPYPWFTTHL